MRLNMKTLLLIALSLASLSSFADIKIKRVQGDISEKYFDESNWKTAEVDQTISLMGQPMVAPKPKATETSSIVVTAVHDGKWIAFRLKWKCNKPEAGGQLATFSDAVAMEFPIKDNENPPPIFMGGKDDPVHMFHWRYQYQLDEENGKKTVEQIYPNKTIDMYPLEYKEKGNFKTATQEERDSFVGGTAAGNPQSFQKKSIDEVFAEGFGSSSVSGVRLAKAKGLWKDGVWTVFIARPLVYETGSKLIPGKKSHIGFAVWQGGKKEVGAIKSLTMTWTPIFIEEK